MVTYKEGTGQSCISYMELIRFKASSWRRERTYQRRWRPRCHHHHYYLQLPFPSHEASPCERRVQRWGWQRLRQVWPWDRTRKGERVMAYRCTRRGLLRLWRLDLYTAGRRRTHDEDVQSGRELSSTAGRVEYMAEWKRKREWMPSSLSMVAG